MLILYILHLTEECSERNQKNSNLKTCAEYYPEMFVVTCDKGAVIYKTAISILASVEESDLFQKPTAFGHNNFQSNIVKHLQAEAWHRTHLYSVSFHA
jgi:hypothetical protein